MSRIFLYCSIVTIVAYFVYVLFWRISAIHEGLIKKSHEKALCANVGETPYP